ncbi:uncharacterized protein LOC117143283 [Drosophila mauritiana]|uniref:Uncharacterized protein LOC117143283 n=1 Tax=Drosophila mauritiana TaxID=7226 RepID=A0A6P8K506_DROMA|nr:uncharacterized protein LOC117143283 [Drosophila mauritiana]
MPKRVITRRQRKAAESRLKATKEASQEDDLIILENILVPPMSTNLISSEETYLKKKDIDMMSQTTLDGKNEKAKSPSSEQSIKESEKNIQLCDALQKIRLTSHKKTFLSEVRKKAFEAEQFRNTTSSGYDKDNKFIALLPRNTNKGANKTPSSGVPLMSKFCEQIKTHFNSVLPTRNLVGSKSQIPIKNEPEHGADGNSTPRKVFSSSQNEAKTDGDNYPKINSFKPSELARHPRPPIRIFGLTGFFALTGNNAQLSFHIGQLAIRGVYVQSCIHLQPELMDTVEEQLAKLAMDRKIILNKMKNKHATLAPRRARQETRQGKK